MDFELKAEQLARGALPKTEAGWSVCDEDGWTLAHAAAVRNLLPGNFSYWDLADDSGMTVAHVAAEHGHLPDRLRADNRIMALATKSGVTVKQLYEKKAKAHLQKCYSILAS